MPQTLTRIATTALLALAAALGHAQVGDWGDVTIVSGTVGNNPNRLCMGVPDHMRPADIGCPSYAPSLSTAGHVSITGNVSANKFIGDGAGLTNLNVQGDRIVSDTHTVIVNQNTGYVSLTTGGSTWGYLSAGWSYLSNLFANTVSSSLVSATNVSATYVDATRSGTVSATYGYFRYISGTDIYGRFAGDGSGLTGVGQGDRITSGTTSVIAYEDRSITFITAASQRVIVGENGNVGIGNGSPYTLLDLSGEDGATLTFRTRGTVMADGVRLGGFRFDSDDSNTNSVAYGASIEAFAGGAWADGGAGSSAYMVFSTAPAFSSVYAPIERMRILSSGNVGLGTQSPTATLQVSGTFTVSSTVSPSMPSLYVDASRGYTGVGTASPGSQLHVSGTGQLRLSGLMARLTLEPFNNGTGNLWNIDNYLGDMRFYTANYSPADYGTSGVVRMIIVSATGNIGIGRSAPLARLDVLGTISASDAVQVGSSSLTCSAGIPGAIRYNAGSLELCDGTSWGALAGSSALGDRIISGTTNVIATQDRSVTITTNGVQRMIVGENGYIGLGTANPTGSLDVRGAGTTKLDYSDGDSLGSALVLRDTQPNQQSGGQILFGSSQGLFAGIKSELRSGSGPAGNLVFQTRSTSGDILRRMTVFYDGRVGIGTSATTVPTTLLVSGSFAVSTSAQTTTPSLYVGTEGKVGIGTQSPTAKLYVETGTANDGIYLKGNSAASNAVIRVINDAGIFSDILVGRSGNATLANKLLITGPSSTTGLGGIIIDGSGNVGVGGSHFPLAKFDVVGTISASDALQVGTSSLACSAGIPGAIRYNSGSLELCNGTSWSALGGSSALGDRITSGTTNAIATQDRSVTISTAGTQRLLVGENGRVGIGTDNPLNNLTIHQMDSSYNNLQFTNTDSGQGAVDGFRIGLMSTEDAIAIHGNRKSLYLGTSNTVRVRIDPDGNTAFGTGYSSPSSATVFISGSLVVSTSAQTTTPTLIVGTNGNVGIGLVAPNAKLEVRVPDSSGSTEEEVLRLSKDFATNGGDGTFISGAMGSTVYSKLNFITAATNDATMRFDLRDSGSTFAQVMTLRSTGRVGIGTNNPSYALDVNGYAAATAVYQTSDARLKANIAQLPSGLSVIEKLNPVTFDWKDTKRHAAGLIAQEVATVVPTAVSSDTTGKLSLDYSQVIPYLIRGVQELKAANDRLASDVADLVKEKKIRDRENVALAKQNADLLRRLGLLERKVNLR